MLEDISDSERIELEVDSLRAQIASLQAQMDELSQRVARVPQPIRPNWLRKSAIADLETAEVTAIRPKIRKTQLKAVPKIARVTISISGHKQYVNSYDAHGERIEAYCGWFGEIGLEVLRVAGHLLWKEAVAESA